MLKFITQRNKEQFSNVKFDYDWFAFNNGSLNIKTMEFINLEDIDPNTTIIARKFFNKSFNPNNTETPLLDKALLHQIKDIEILNILYGLIGGLLFKTENDKFQCAPILWGDLSTFKRCILNIIALFCNFIGTITFTYDPIFGFEPASCATLVKRPRSCTNSCECESLLFSGRVSR